MVTLRECVYHYFLNSLLLTKIHENCRVIITCLHTLQQRHHIVSPVSLRDQYIHLQFLKLVCFISCVEPYSKNLYLRNCKTEP